MIAAEKWRSLAAAACARWSAAYGVTVPTDVVVAMIQQESAGNPKATRREPDGRTSRGLLQVLDDTARQLGLKNTMQLYDPATGIEYGVKYLAQQVRRYGGNVSHAIAAYNAGSVKFTTAETYRNQSYVDGVKRWMSRLEKVVKPVGAALPVLALLIGAAFLFARRRPRRRSVADAA